MDTFKALKARLGSGSPMKGSRGYAWTWRAARCVIRATFASVPDAPEAPVFDADIVQAVSLECMPPGSSGDPNCPEVHGYVRELGWMGAVIPGMPRSKLDAAVRRLPRCEQHGEELIWRASSPAPHGQRWAAVVRIKDGKVASVRVATP